MKLVVIFTLALALTATFHVLAAQPVENASAVSKPATPNLEQLSDPAEFSDDICWVAPEWRDD